MMTALPQPDEDRTPSDHPTTEEALPRLGPEAVENEQPGKPRKTVLDGQDLRLLRIYLQDHQAGGVAGRALARRTLDNNRGGDFEAPLRTITDEIGRDLDHLVDVMRRVGIHPHPMKPRVTRVLEWLGRMKHNGSFRGYSPLSRVTELEGLTMGVTGKLALWSCLEALSESFPQWHDIDFSNDVASAQAQLASLEGMRGSADAIAFGGPIRAT